MTPRHSVASQRPCLARLDIYAEPIVCDQRDGHHGPHGSDAREVRVTWTKPYERTVHA